MFTDDVTHPDIQAYWLEIYYMKKLIGAFALILILAVSCSKDALRSDLDDSYDKWEDFKKANNNSYYYTVKTVSWDGNSTATSIIVHNGVVTARVYKRYLMDGSNGQQTLKASWNEDTASLNSHQEGAETLTLDQVYDKAKNVWLKADKKENAISFEAKNDGMISSCGYVPNGCMDDCFIGISISEIKPLSNW